MSNADPCQRNMLQHQRQLVATPQPALWGPLGVHWVPLRVGADQG